jgi:tryptophan synthase beta chain
MYTLGHTFIPPSIHAGGLRYHGDAPLVCHLYHLGLISASALDQLEVFEAGVAFARTEGIIPAPESAHAIAQVLLEVKQAEEEGKSKVILFNLSGHGLLDLSAYDAFLAGKLINFPYPREKIAQALSELPQVREG